MNKLNKAQKIFVDLSFWRQEVCIIKKFATQLNQKIVTPLDIAVIVRKVQIYTYCPDDYLHMELGQATTLAATSETSGSGRGITAFCINPLKYGVYCLASQHIIEASDEISEMRESPVTTIFHWKKIVLDMRSKIEQTLSKKD